MLWFVCFVIGLIGGASCAIGALWGRVEKARRAREHAAQHLAEAKRKRDEASEREKSLNRLETELRVRQQDQLKQMAAAQQQHEANMAAAQEMLGTRLANEKREHERRLASTESELEGRMVAFRNKVISYNELEQENALLKRDLQNIDVTLNKRVMDNELLNQQQVVLDERSSALATRYLAETTKWISQSLTANNYAAQKDRLTDAIQRVRSIGFNITADEEALRIAELKQEYERVVRVAVQREEQARIKAQIREEERLQREAQRVIDQSKRESDMIQAALDKAMLEARGQHNAEVEHLKQQLAEAEAKSARAISMAQQTKAGHIYVISNLGSFGENVFKVGMTRRLEPLDRIRELGDASVPFPFDIHMMISCQDAPALENALHRALHRTRLNKVNPRKEYFRADLNSIVEIVKAHHGQVEYVADPTAFEYRESLRMSDEDAEFVEQVFEEAEPDIANATED